jgi:hypothetical protein
LQFAFLVVASRCLSMCASLPHTSWDMGMVQRTQEFDGMVTELACVAFVSLMERER